MKHKNITMKTIAEKAGVSITTVSHVINKTRRVNQDTKEAVLRIMEELNYRGYNSKKVNKIEYVGVIIADIREDYYVATTKAIETVASDMGISIIFCDSQDDPEKEEKNIKMLLDKNISGLILAPIEAQKMPESLADIDIPVVLIDRQYENHDFLFIGINNFYSSYLGAKHLNNKGADRIGFIGYSESVSTIKQRILGYKSFLMEQEKETGNAVLSLSYHTEDSVPLIKNFIKDKQINGVICATSAICYEVLSALSDMDQEYQDNLRIITYDDNRWFDFLKVPVSVISQPTAEIGTAAIENLISFIEQQSHKDTLKRELFFDVSIIDRL
ncbi:MAG: LacI family DNA-binding transcriptional regulator [Spirochaetales bacterium]|nr:LacI family DNA-binding transcriptional regulator [Spirochaetales bacterium]